MSVIHAPRETPLDARSLFGLGVVAAVLLGYGFRLWYIQTAMAGDLRERAERSSRVEVARLAPRGQIIARDGTVLAGTTPRAVLVVMPKTALKDDATLERVAGAIGVNPKKLKRKIAEHTSKGDLPVPTLIALSPRAASWVAERKSALPGYDVATVPVRTYRDPFSMGHLLGYVGVPSERDIARLEGLGVTPAAYVGKDGLERRWEQRLMGEPGHTRVSVDAHRRPVENLGEEHPTAGDSLVLGLDYRLQRYCVTKLAGRRGAIVALDPSTGDVLAMVSSPAYDASRFLDGISTEEYAALRDDPAKPLFHRAVGAAYAPGSTFKIVTSIAAAQAGMLSAGTTSVCRGYYQVGNKRFRCLGTHGAVGFDRAMTKSCNAFFADLAVRTGPEALRTTCAQIGLGARLGIDLPAEAPGLVATEEWWAKHRNRRWSPGDTANFGVGQGELACTPLQMACVAALVANRGVLYRPRLVRAVQDSREGAKAVAFPPEESARIELGDAFWDALQASLRNVVLAGTARSAQRPGIEIAGKTGSAENAPSRETHSWFVAYAPAARPKIAIAVVVENAGHGGEVAAPIAGDVLRAYFEGSKETEASASAAVGAQGSSGLSRR